MDRNPKTPQPDWRYEIVARGPESTDILIMGDIGENWWDPEQSITAKSFVTDLAAVATPNVRVRLNTIGGSVPDGLGIYNALRAFKGNVTVAIEGVALSVGSLIAMAGESVQMAANAMMMIHAPWGMYAGNAAALREKADMLDRYAGAMATSYVRGSMTREAAQALLSDGKDHWYTAEEALAAGLIDEITNEVEVSAKFDLTRFRSVPAAAAVYALHSPKENVPMDPKNTPAAADIVATPAAASAASAAAPATPATPVAPVAAPVLAAVPTGRTTEQAAEIRAAFSPFMATAGVSDLLIETLSDASVSAAAATQKLLAHLGKGKEPARAPGDPTRVETLEDERDKIRAAGVSAILARASMPEKGVNMAANPFRGYRLLDHAREALVRAGFSERDVRQMDEMRVVGLSFTHSTSDFPVLLENTMHKALQAAWNIAPDTWSKFCAVGSVSDFRAHNRYKVGSLANLQAVNELGEFKYAAIPDGEKTSISATTKGNIVSISRQAIVNDDMAALTSIPAMMGRAAKRSIEVDVYALLNSASGVGPTMGDSVAMFHSSHGNLAASGAVPTMALVDAARAAMAVQKDISGNDYLDLRPVIALCGTAQGGNLRSINDAQYDPDTANKLQKPNIVRGLVREVIDSPRTYLTSWYLFADPNECPAFEVAFLNGEQEPFMEMQNGFTVDGVAYKVRLDYGVAAREWRGVYRNPGA